MGYIYVIENDINDKVYVGKTTDTLSNRFSKHCWEAHNRTSHTSPLHNAIFKYGAEHFWIRPLEECANEILSEREIFWIDKMQVYIDDSIGYNATRGGEGNPKYDPQEIISLWKQGYNQKQIAEKLGCERHTIKKYLEGADISLEERQKHKLGNAAKQVQQIDIHTDVVVAEYSSLAEAARMVEGTQSGICRACRGSLKTHKGYKWKYK